MSNGHVHTAEHTGEGDDVAKNKTKKKQKKNGEEDDALLICACRLVLSVLLGQ